MNRCQQRSYRTCGYLYGITYLPVSGGIVYPVHLRIQGDHSTAFTAVVAPEDVLAEMQIHLAFLPAQRTVHVHVLTAPVPDRQIQQRCYVQDGKCEGIHDSNLLSES